jgi:hypothetical protein
MNLIPMDPVEIRQDYIALLRTEGVSEQTAREQSENPADRIDLPLPGNLRLGESTIEGQGLFAASAISAGATLMPARLSGKRTAAGRFVNHSPEPNVKMVPEGEDLVMVALRDIDTGEELVSDYRVTRSTVRAIEKARLEEYHRKVDALEAGLSQFEQIEVPTKHRFLSNPGMYIREATAPAGSILTSKEHLTDHPFVMLSGEQSILEPDGTWKRVAAPFMGFTKAGSRRVVMIHADTTMVTFHATEETDLDSVEESLFRMRTEHLPAIPGKLAELQAIQHGKNSQIIRGTSA